MLSLSIVSFSLSIYYFYHTNKELEKAEKKFTQQQRKNSFSAEQITLYRKNIDKYDQLRSRGVIGNNFRLQWIETLQAVGENYEIPAIDFTLENAKDADELKDFYIHPEQPYETTQMDIRFDLLHEGDFFLMLKFLRNKSLGIFSIEECNLYRKDLGKENTPFSGFAGDCEFQWYTLSDITISEDVSL